MNTKQTSAGAPLPLTPCSPSSILAATWRQRADHCEAEIERSKGKKATLHLSVEGRICYEQAARTLRQCADEIHSQENAQAMASADNQTPPKETTS
jgi:hypothetical protein